MKGYGKTDVGRIRLVNQDTFSALEMDNGCFVAVVCDGMGGAAGGGIASAIAKDIFLTELEKRLDDFVYNRREDSESSLEMPRILREAVRACNAFTFDLATKDKSLHGMGTTLVAALIFKNTLYACNVGDSRLYYFSDKKAYQITKDHSYVQAMVDSGKMTVAQARNSTRKNIITKAVGIENTVDADVFSVSLEEGMQYFLLCSDGLSNLIDKEDMKRIILQPKELLGLEKKVECLIGLANERGGTDNITAYLIEANR
ncbi:MAG: Stp1/IreP family PP2C-type Ser/Thr phosphatase [Clostridia bacterium]|nr:Stp1/IreP family PP2C-type Ser/Thr phosphatase [Clostridia bacterium]